MTITSTKKQLRAALKAYNALWDRLEDLESDLDDADQQDPPLTLDLTGWGVAEMRDGLGFAIGNLDDAIKEAKKLAKRKR